VCRGVKTSKSRAAIALLVSRIWRERIYIGLFLSFARKKKKETFSEKRFLLTSSVFFTIERVD